MDRKQAWRRWVILAAALVGMYGALYLAYADVFMYEDDYVYGSLVYNAVPKGQASLRQVAVDVYKQYLGQGGRLLAYTLQTALLQRGIEPWRALAPLTTLLLVALLFRAVRGRYPGEPCDLGEIALRAMPRPEYGLYFGDWGDGWVSANLREYYELDGNLSITYR